MSSIPVIEELEEGSHPRKKETIQLMEKIKLLPVNDSIIEIVDMYIENFIMPNNPRGDAIHLNLASYHRCQFLLTWNCAH